MRVGQRLDVLLLKSDHLEAVLDEAVDPLLLFAGLLDRAHFFGEPLTEIDELSSPPDTLARDIRWEWESNHIGFDEETSWGPAKLFDLPDNTSCSIAELADGGFLHASRRGILEIDPEKRSVAPYCGVPTESLVRDADEIWAVGYGMRGMIRCEPSDGVMRAPFSSAEGEFVAPNWWHDMTKGWSYDSTFADVVDGRRVPVDGGDKERLCVLDGGSVIGLIASKSPGIINYYPRGREAEFLSLNPGVWAEDVAPFPLLPLDAERFAFIGHDSEDYDQYYVLFVCDLGCARVEELARIASSPGRRIDLVRSTKGTIVVGVSHTSSGQPRIAYYQL